MVHSVHLGLFGPIWPIQAYYINACISQSLSQTYSSSSLASLLHSCYYFLNCFNNKSLVFFLYSLSSLSPPHSTSQFLVSEKVFQAMSLSHGETPRTETPHYTTTPAYDEDENVTASTTLFSEDDRVLPHSTSQFLVSDKKSKILLYHQFEKVFFLDDGHDKFEELLFNAMCLGHGETPRTETPHYTTAPSSDEDENMNAATTLVSEDVHVANSVCISPPCY